MSNRKVWNLFVLVALLLGLLPMVATAQPAAQPDWAKVDPRLVEKVKAEGQAGFVAILTVQADLSGAGALQTKAEKTAYVFDLLRQVAKETQGPVMDYLRSQGVKFEAHYIQNLIQVEAAGMGVIEGLAARPDVAQIVSEPTPELEPVWKEMTVQEKVEAIEWNVARVHAPEVWDMGFHGEGMVVANNDTGVYYQHPALVDKYRGNLGGGQFDHNYNWWDDLCGGYDYPYDCDSHGTHTMGTMVGDDGAGNQIGVAPGAQWIACAGMSLECFEFFLAPWDLNQQNPDPTKSPDAINNSWYDPSPFDYRPIIQALNAAGIAVIKSAGNNGPGCGTISNPGYVPEIIATAAFAQGDTIASFSSRGPESMYGETILKPEVAAPGVNVRSSVPGGGYEGGWNGTSMAAPHSTALVALIWNAAPCLVGDVPTTKQIMMETAEAKIDPQCPPFVDHPNDVWGWGILDDLAAVQYAIGYCGGLGTLEGTVTDAATSSPLVGVAVKAQAGGGYNKTVYTDASGFYTMDIPADTYDVTATVYGYEPATASGVVVEVDQITVQDFALNPLPVYTVSGYVKDAVTNAPLAATVEFTDVPLPPVNTNPGTGFYSIDVAEGTWHLMAAAAMHQSVTVEVIVAGNVAQDFFLDPLPCILLVDDDGDGPDVRAYYTSALDNLGLDYAVWDVLSQGDPSADNLAGYSMVFWFNGYPYSNTFNSANEAAVAAYLDAGGRFFLSGQDYLYDMGLTTFGQNYLHIASFNSDVSQTTVTGQNVFAGLGPYALSYPFTNYSDAVNPDAQAQVAFQGNQGSAAVSFSGASFQTVFFGFPLEAVPNLADRAAILGTMADWFGGCEPPVQDTMHVNAIEGNFTMDPYGRTVLRMRVQAVDQDIVPLEGVTVDASLWWPTGGPVQRSRYTRATGWARFHWGSPNTGTWQICVDNLALAGYVYNPGDNVVTCQTWDN